VDKDDPKQTSMITVEEASDELVEPSKKDRASDIPDESSSDSHDRSN